MYNTGSQGFLCRCVYVVEKLEYTKLISLKFVLDRNKGIPIIKYSNSAKCFTKMEPNEYFTLDVDFMKGLSMIELLNMAKNLGIEA